MAVIDGIIPMNGRPRWQCKRLLTVKPFETILARPAKKRLNPYLEKNSSQIIVRIFQFLANNAEIVLNKNLRDLSVFGCINVKDSLTVNL